MRAEKAYVQWIKHFIFFHGNLYLVRHCCLGQEIEEGGLANFLEGVVLFEEGGVVKVTTPLSVAPVQLPEGLCLQRVPRTWCGMVPANNALERDARYARAPQC